MNATDNRWLKTSNSKHKSIYCYSMCDPFSTGKNRSWISVSHCSRLSEPISIAWLPVKIRRLLLEPLQLLPEIGRDQSVIKKLVKIR